MLGVEWGMDAGYVASLNLPLDLIQLGNIPYDHSRMSCGLSTWNSTVI